MPEVQDPQRGVRGCELPALRSQNPPQTQPDQQVAADGIGRPAARSHSNTAVRDQVAWLKTQLVVCWSRTSVLRNANSQEPELPAALAAPVSVLSAHGLKRCEASHVPNSGNIFLDIEC